jgi:hypothetical protein
LACCDFVTQGLLVTSSSSASHNYVSQYVHTGLKVFLAASTTVTKETEGSGMVFEEQTPISTASEMVQEELGWSKEVCMLASHKLQDSFEGNDEAVQYEWEMSTKEFISVLGVGRTIMIMIYKQNCNQENNEQCMVNDG